MKSINCYLSRSYVFKKLVLSFFIVLVVTACSEKQNVEQATDSYIGNQKQDSKWVVKAKQLTRQHKLTSLAIECLAFEEQDIVKGKMEIVVREVHNEKCGGDPRTEPRVLSMEVTLATGEIKTDRYSPSAEYESFDNLSIEDGL